jgi:hypothetical protein
MANELAMNQSMTLVRDERRTIFKPSGSGPLWRRFRARDVGLFHLTGAAASCTWEVFLPTAAADRMNFAQRTPRYDQQGASVDASRKRLDALARLLDSAVAIPGTNIRFGADALLNVIPGFGLVTAKALSAYLIWEARRLGVPSSTLARMLGHLGVDFVISAVPVVGWVGDAFYRANLKNMALLREHLDRRAGEPEILAPLDTRGGA